MSIDAVAQSQLLLAQGLESLADTLNNSPAMQVSTRDAITTLQVPNAVLGIQVQGTSAATDGGQGIYARASSSGTAIQSADGAYWELTTPNYVNIASTGTATMEYLTVGGTSTAVVLAAAGTTQVVSLTASGAISTADTISGVSIVTDSTVLHVTSSPLGSTSGGLTATLTNSPRTGNPLKWIKISDNGTVRWIPTW